MAVLFFQLIAAGLIIVGLIGLTDPVPGKRATAIWLAGFGVALIAGLFDPWIESYLPMSITLAFGLAIGWFAAPLLDDPNRRHAGPLLNAFGALAAILVSMAEHHKAAARQLALRIERDEFWKGTPLSVREAQGATVAIPFSLTATQQSMLVLVAVAGGLALGAGVVAFLKGTRKELVSNFIQPDEPAKYLFGLSVAMFLLAILITAWPHRASFLWAIAVIATAMGYIHAITQKRKRLPVLRPMILCGTGLAVVGAGYLLGHLLVLIAGGLTAGAGAMLASQAFAAAKASADRPAQPIEEPAITTSPVDPVPPPVSI
jgi:NAD/NADP transhydrogenase beta subunit